MEGWQEWHNEDEEIEEETYYEYQRKQRRRGERAKESIDSLSKEYTSLGTSYKWVMIWYIITENATTWFFTIYRFRTLVLISVKN